MLQPNNFYSLKGIIFLVIIFQTIFPAQLMGQKKAFLQESQINTSVSPFFSELQHSYDVKFYFIDLEVSNTTSIVKGNTSILVESINGTIDTLTFELSVNMWVDSVKVNSQIIPTFFSTNNLLKILLPDHLKNEALLEAKVYYSGNAGTGGFFGGARTVKENTYDKWVTFTLSEPFQSMNWFPCKQDLTDKADSAWVFITVDNQLKAGANGLLTATTPVGEGKTRYEWKTNYPITYYLLSFSVADYLEYTFYVDIPGTGHSMPVQNYLYNHPSLPDSEKARIDVTKDLLLLYSELLGTYPFYLEKYGHCLAPMGGGMEHQTMTTLTHFNFGLVAHELAHQWYGNYVTCKTWQDIWINEGFASYLEYIAIEMLRPQEEANRWLEQAQSSALVFPQGSVYLTMEEAHQVDRIFNVELSYKKGAVILHMLRYELNNDSLFFEILKGFASKYAFQTATGADFSDYFSLMAGADYSWFFEQWYYGKGYPLFLTTWKQVSDSLIIEGLQETTSTHTPFFRTSMEYKIVYNDGSDEIIKLEYLKNEEHFVFHTKKVVENILADPRNILLKTSVILKQINQNQIFEVAPNPFGNKLTIRFGNQNKSRGIRLTSLNGNLVFENISNSWVFSQDLPFLNPGIYILTITEDGKEYSLKVVKTSQFRS